MPQFRSLGLGVLRQVEEIMRAKYGQPLITDPAHLASETTRYDYAMKIGQYSVLIEVRQAILLLENNTEAKE